MAARRWPAVRTIVVTPDDRTLYSGMIPGFVQGRYRLHELAFDLRRLCTRAGAELVEEPAVAVDGGTREVRTATRTIPFTAASVDVGSVAVGGDFPGVQKYAVSVKSAEGVLRLVEILDTAAPTRSWRIAIVGGGAAGVEIGLAARRRLRDRQVHAALTLLDSGPTALPDHPEGARRLAARLVLENEGVLRLGEEVTAVLPEGVHLTSGEVCPADLVVWATGPAPPPLLSDSTLPLTPDGYFHVDATLRSIDGAPVWGAGDCIHLDGHSLPKAGVFAVRQGPLLAANLNAFLAGRPPRVFRTRARYLSLLDTADGRALLRYGGFSHHGRLALRLKKLIDRRFARRFRGESPG